MTAEDLVKIFLKISCQNSLGIMLEKVGWIFFKVGMAGIVYFLWEIFPS